MKKSIKNLETKAIKAVVTVKGGTDVVCPQFTIKTYVSY